MIHNQWDAEWQAASFQIENLYASYQQEMPALAPLIDAFGQFSKEQFNLFQDGFAGRDSYRLEQDLAYPSAYVIRTILTQIGEDLTVLRRIYHDYQFGMPGETTTLKDANWLANSALGAVTTNSEDAGLIEPTRALSYFQKNISVRVVPYANVAYIGIPPTTITLENTKANKRPLIATAHEVGHHVYWHGKHENIRLPVVLRSYLRERPDWLRNWLEELFADVLSALVGGEVMALSAQAMMADNFPQYATRDNGHYPIDAIRPFIYIDAMRLANEFVPNLYEDQFLDKLDQQWGHRLIEWGDPTSFQPNQAGKEPSQESVSLTDARLELKKAIKTIIVDILQPYLTRLDTAWTPTDQSKSFRKKIMDAGQRQTELESLYEAFETLLGEIKDDQVNEVQIAKSTTGWRQELRQLIHKSEGNDILSVPAYAWIGYFRDNDWISGGPETEPDIG